jgi:ADP-heptose:LPS heptosyltransferase
MRGSFFDQVFVSGNCSAQSILDKVFTFEKDIHEVTNELKAEQYDFVVDLHHNLRTLRLKRLLKRPSAAFPKLNIRKYFYVRFKWSVMPDVHIVDRYFEAVKSLGVCKRWIGVGLFYSAGRGNRHY